jgi:hypothetical protein
VQRDGEHRHDGDQVLEAATIPARVSTWPVGLIRLIGPGRSGTRPRERGNRPHPPVWLVWADRAPVRLVTFGPGPMLRGRGRW